MTRALVGMVVVGAALTATAQKPADVPTFPKGTMTVTLPYTRPVDFKHLTSLSVRMSFNGGPASGYQVDTGSVGIVVGAQNIPDFDGKGEPGELTYSSSGVHEVGVWKDVEVTFPDVTLPNGKPVTAHVRVLAVTSMDCATTTAVNHCTPPTGAPNPHMLGIGFGRGKGDVFDSAIKNAFLMLDAMQNGQMRRGYTITPAGIQLGLNAETFAGDWKWQKLEPREGSAKTPDDYRGPKDWETAAGTFAVSGKTMPMGTVLMDTGLRNMIMEAKGAPTEGDLPAGTPVRVDLLGGQLHYEFLVNDATNPATPSKASWRAAPHGTYVNTGLKALSLFDYAYDADGGYLGLKTR